MSNSPVCEVIHFYYCLSVAVKINKRYSRGMTYIHTNIFILKWLENARMHSYFGKTVLSEINWMADHIRARGPLFRHAEKLIDTIYTSCTEMMSEI